jgi:hypothetical protein
MKNPVIRKIQTRNRPTALSTCSGDPSLSAAATPAMNSQPMPASARNAKIRKGIPGNPWRDRSRIIVSSNIEVISLRHHIRMRRPECFSGTPQD